MYSKLPFHVWVLEFSQSLTRWHKNNNKWLMLLCTKAHSKQTHHSRCHFKTETSFWARLNNHINAVPDLKGNKDINMQHQSLFNKNQWTQLIKRLSVVTVLGLTIAAPAWAIDPTVKELRIGFQKVRLTLRLPNNKNYLNKNFQMPKLLGTSSLLVHNFRSFSCRFTDVGVTGDTPCLHASG